MRMPMVGSFTLKPGFILLCFQPANPLILLLFWRPFCLVLHLVQCIIFSSHISTHFGLHQTSACSVYDRKYCTLTYQFMICEIWGPEAKVLLDLHCTESLYSKPKGLFSEKLSRKNIGSTTGFFLLLLLWFTSKHCHVPKWRSVLHTRARAPLHYMVLRSNSWLWCVDGTQTIQPVHSPSLPSGNF